MTVNLITGDEICQFESNANAWEDSLNRRKLQGPTHSRQGENFSANRIKLIRAPSVKTTSVFIKKTNFLDYSLSLTVRKMMTYRCVDQGDESFATKIFHFMKGKICPVRHQNMLIVRHIENLVQCRRSYRTVFFVWTPIHLDEESTNTIKSQNGRVSLTSSHPTENYNWRQCVLLTLV